MKEYRIDIDILKGISIIAVILFHMGICPHGYLGVDTFLVINGFFIIPSIIKSLTNGTFHYFQWLNKRLSRFIPLLIVALVSSLLLGAFCMLPDDYENLSESVVASGLFSNNVLSAITTRNYWDSSNDFKPLMHLWYLGILVQFYVVFPVFLLLIKSLSRKGSNLEKILKSSVVVLGLICFVLYLLPFNSSDKFYYLPFRTWEFCVGGIAGLLLASKAFKFPKGLSIVFLTVLLLGFFLPVKSLSELDNITIIGAASVSKTNPVIPYLYLIGTVVITMILLLKNNIVSNSQQNHLSIKLLAFLGKMSFSLYIWHQIILAFLRYTIIEKFDILSVIGFLLAILIISVLSYKFIEKIKLDTVWKSMTAYSCLGVLIIFGFCIYRHAGVIRDIPELGITMENPYACRNTEYTDKIYSYDSPFCSDKIKVLVVGNSFARDFACVLLEWDKNSEIELSYKFSFGDDMDDRYGECDYLFSFGDKNDVPEFVWDILNPKAKAYGISTKSYGKNMGNVYVHRNDDDYFDSTITYHPLCKEINDKWRSSWGDETFVDLMKGVQLNNGRIRIFTPDNKFISFDCRHLTEYGAKYYAEILDLDSIFKCDL